MTEAHRDHGNCDGDAPRCNLVALRLLPQLISWKAALQRPKLQNPVWLDAAFII